MSWKEGLDGPSPPTGGRCCEGPKSEGAKIFLPDSPCDPGALLLFSGAEDGEFSDCPIEPNDGGPGRNGGACGDASNGKGEKGAIEGGPAGGRDCEAAELCWA